MLGHARQYVGKAVGQAASFPPISICHGPDCDAKHHAASESSDEELADLQLAKVVHAVEGVDIRALQPIAQHGACIHHKVGLLESAAGRAQDIGSEMVQTDPSRVIYSGCVLAVHATHCHLFVKLHGTNKWQWVHTMPRP